MNMKVGAVALRRDRGYLVVIVKKSCQRGLARDPCPLTVAQMMSEKGLHTLPAVYRGSARPIVLKQQEQSG